MHGRGHINIEQKWWSNSNNTKSTGSYCLHLSQLCY